jgi:hypothetical protein
MIIGSLAAAANGTALPAMIIVFGDMIDLFVDTGKLTQFLLTITSFLNSKNLTMTEVLMNSRMME